MSALGGKRTLEGGYFLVRNCLHRIFKRSHRQAVCLAESIGSVSCDDRTGLLGERKHLHLLDVIDHLAVIVIHGLHSAPHLFDLFENREPHRCIEWHRVSQHDKIRLP
jgi:hypothetical protein